MKQDIDKVSFPEMMNDSSGKSSLAPILALVFSIVGLSVFVVMSVATLVTKLSPNVSAYVTLASLAAAIAGSGAAVIFGHHAYDSKLANTIASMPDNQYTHIAKEGIDILTQKKTEDA